VVRTAIASATEVHTVLVYCPSVRPIPQRQGLSVANGASGAVHQQRVRVTEESRVNRMVISAFPQR
jgi:hypothetical protein